MPHSSNASLTACNTTSQTNSASSNETDHQEDGPVHVLSSSLIVVLAFICLLIIAVNGLVIYLIYRKKTLRSLTNMFLTSLAVLDLISGFIGIPLVILCQTKNILKVCVSSTIFIRFTAISSVFHVILIACDRYIAIVHSLHHDAIVTKWRAIGAISFVWLFSSAASVIQMSWYSVDETNLEDYEKTEAFDVKYTKACIVLFFAVPLLMICYIYGHIFYISCKSIKSDRELANSLQQRQRSLLREWRGRSVLLIMVVIFGGCWLPFFLAMLGDHKESSELSLRSLWVERLLVVLAFIPPLLNPLLCTLAKRDFRRALKGVVLRKNASQQHEERAYFQKSATDNV